MLARECARNMVAICIYLFIIVKIAASRYDHLKN